MGSGVAIELVTQDKNEVTLHEMFTMLEECAPKSNAHPM